MALSVKKNARNRRESKLSVEKGKKVTGVFIENLERFYLLLIAGLLLLLWALLWSRFFVLQVVQGPEYAAMAMRQHQTQEILSGKRGSIYDRNGNVLASTVLSYSISAKPHEIKDVEATELFLSQALQLPKNKISGSLRSSKHFVWIARKVSDRSAKLIQEGNLPGIYLHTEYDRVYPYKHLAGQLLGFVGMDNKGLDGLEAAFDERLSGRELRLMVQRDGRGKRLHVFSDSELARLEGKDLHLSLDIQIQYIAETALAEAVAEYRGKWGGVLVADVDSGEILAWAQYPFFNPNIYNKYSSDIWRNRLALDALEHGSTIKPFLVAAALNEKVVTKSSVFFCENGKWTLRNRQIIRDTRPRGDLNIEQILRYSSNIGVGKIALVLGAKRYGDYLQRLGFGKRSGLPLVGENPGILREPEKWPESDLASSAFGQSFSSTSLQMTQAYVCLANMGKKKPLQLLLDKELRQPESSEQIYSPEVSAEVLRMLRSVVQADDGGGRQARIPHIEVGGKTGTAQKAEKGIYGEKRVASFAGLVPAEQPKYVVLVIVDEPQKNIYGGSVAAPVFRKVAQATVAYERYLPELPDTSVLGVGQQEFAAVSAQNSGRGDAQPISHTPGIQPVSANNGLGTVIIPGTAGNSNELPPVLRKVPDVSGKNVQEAVEIFARHGVMPKLQGTGSMVVRQVPAPGSDWPRISGMECTLWIEEEQL